jgi:hypothetical protein
MNFKANDMWEIKEGPLHSNAEYLQQFSTAFSTPDELTITAEEAIVTSLKFFCRTSLE